MYIKRLIIVLLIGIMLISGIVIYKNLQENKEQENIFQELSDIANEIGENNKETVSQKNISSLTVSNYEKLYSINLDMIGWIKIKGTNVNYPVMQTKDNPNYYLRKNFYKEYSFYGTPYIAEYCSITSSDNIIIYGHHIKNGQIFGILEKYKSRAFYESHKIIDFNTKYENSSYEIIAVFKIDISSEFEYYKFYNAKNENEFNSFIVNCRKLSFYDTKISANYGDKLITLSTCEYSLKNGRLVVVARKI